MTKHGFSESIKSFFGDHIHHEKTQEHETNKTDFEDKVKKLLKLTKEVDNEAESDKSSEIVRLVENVREQYESLHNLYSHLTGELRNKADYKGKTDGSSSSSSSSDSESDHSSKKQTKKKSKRENGSKNLTESLKHEPEVTNKKLAAISDEIEALNLKMQESDKIIEDLKKIEAELNQKLEDRKKQNEALITENSTFVAKLEEREDAFSALSKKYSDLESEKSAAVHGLEAQIADLKLELDALSTREKDLQEQIGSKTSEAIQLREENSSLQLLKTELQDQVLVVESKLSEKIEELSGVLSNLQQEIDTLRLQNGELEEQVKTKTSYANQLKEDISALDILKSNLEGRIIGFEEDLRSKDGNLNDLLKQLEDVKIKTSEEGDALREDLTAKIKSLELEVGSLGTQKSELEEQLRIKVSQAEQSWGENSGLRLLKSSMEEQISNLNNLVGEMKVKEENLCDQLRKLEGDQNEALAGTDTLVEGLKTQVSSLQLEVDSLSSQKNELEEQVKAMSYESEQSREEKSEFLLLKSSMEEQIANLNNLLEGMKVKEENLGDQLRKVEGDKNEALAETDTLVEGLKIQVSSLQVEVDSLSSQKNELEEQGKAMSHEYQQLRAENSDLLLLKSSMEEKITNLNNLLEEMKVKEENLCDQLTKLEDGNNVAAAEISSLVEVVEGLKIQVSTLQLEVDSLSSQKCDLEELVKIRTNESEQLRAENSELHAKQTALQEEVSALNQELKEKEESSSGKVDALMDQVKNLQEELTTCKIALERAEENLSELQARLQISDKEKANISEVTESKTAMIEMLQKRQQDLLSNITKLQEEKGDFEVKLHLSNRRLVVAEKTLSEKEATYEKAEKDYLQERKSLEERVVLLTNEISSARSDLKETKDCIHKAVNAFNELEVSVQSSMVDQASNENRISKFTEELQDAKIWATGMNKVKDTLQKKMTALSEELKEKKEKESSLRQKVEKLELMINEEHQEKENLSTKVEVLEKNQKEMKEMMSFRDEEKREAIRQLCLWCDYRNEQCDRLKEIASKILQRHQRTT
ncbi:hypothetical protein MKW98_004984 [Papaver atlanticum]|uniref:NAB domain-containing protein n=1 Tax=Papaver atlanticum TaxID=357466 RepID=A0AAD4THC5_9MAGN|nr:hypothetical protein MKW98_004984 [Papaver atlanticum]